MLSRRARPLYVRGKTTSNNVWVTFFRLLQNIKVFLCSDLSSKCDRILTAIKKFLLYLGLIIFIKSTGFFRPFNAKRKRKSKVAGRPCILMCCQIEQCAWISLELLKSAGDSSYCFNLTKGKSNYEHNNDFKMPDGDI